MDIKNLHIFMKPHIEPITAKKYDVKHMGIDAYSWYHKCAYSLSMELCLDSHNETKLCVPCEATSEKERHKKRGDNGKFLMEVLQEVEVFHLYVLMVFKVMEEM
ncbi:unnamed protein product [Lupinus luteus]|uniref:Uncharacterized protein n=1 Tax=Lupinus luteus TaxID=3873 RepID=A0AAV1VXR2_LUPLU